MRFKNYELACYNKAAGTRILIKGVVYLVQKRNKFLGISYWKTLCKSSPCNPNAYRDAMDYYDLVTWGRLQGLEK